MTRRRWTIAGGTGAALAAVIAATALAAPATASLPTPGEFNVVDDCGAVADGATDNLAALTACIADAEDEGKTLYFPPGAYAIDGALEVSKGGYTFYGNNRATVKIIQQDAAADIFDVDSGTGAVVNQLTLRGMELSYASTSATGTALDCKNCWRVYVQSMGFGDNANPAITKMGAYGIKADGGGQLNILDTVFSYPVDTAIYVVEIGDVLMSDLEVNLSSNTTDIGIHLDTNVGGAYLTNINVNGGGTGLLTTNSRNGVPPNYLFLTNFLADTQAVIGMDLQSAQSVVMTNGWAASAGQTGIVIGDVLGITISASRIYNNGGVGIDVTDGAQDVSIQDSRIAGNSRLFGSGSRKPAIVLRDGADGVMIQNNRIGPLDSFVASQSYAIHIEDGYGDVLMITDNNLLGNVSGEIDNDATVGTHWVVADNL
ncbi:glycosyl hydrolase family 28-related protein [Microbacterium sp.]|uniref:right-handed parallel beta-helix repeat-containing protein n=1 Tax=Microbacterium sp. TaxID=51671 RepID=UPI0039E32064